MDRHIETRGWRNARDLGGLPTTDGGRVRHGAVIRADQPDKLEDAGWAMLREYGVRTVLDLRDEHEREHSAVPADFDVLHVPLDEMAGEEYWAEYGKHDATPLSIRPYLRAAPQAVAAVVTAVARARPGGVLVHCAGGKDRTGIAVLVLLALAGVPGAEIAADYEISYPRMRARYFEIGAGDQQARVEAHLREYGTTMTEAVLDAVASLDAEAYLRSAGVSDADIAAARERLRES